MRTPRRADERIQWRSSIPFALMHLLPLAAVFTGVTAKAVVLCVASYLARIFLITGGYHRYFSHRSYRLGRAPQFVLAVLGTTAAQKGPLWWAAHHREHHRFADTDRDPHSPTKGFWWSHVGWILCARFKGRDDSRVADLARFPELRWVDRHDWVGPWSLGVLSFLVAGWSGLVVGFFLSTVLVWHATFMVNSVAHLVGRRRYATPDTSRNSVLVALLTLGEGWHNNHHRHPGACRQGVRWWEVDVTYAVLRLLAAARIVRDIRRTPVRLLAGDATAEVAASRDALGV